MNPRGDFKALLHRLGPAPDVAARQYEALRRKVIKFFAWEQCAHSEDLADDCLDRVARKLEDGVEIQSVAGYVSGVARLMVKEQQARQRREKAAMEEFSHWMATAGPEAELERAVADLDCCLEGFLPEQRRLILRYYEGDHARRIENRKRLAGEMGMLPNALRNRAMRLRTLLEDCMRKRMGERDTSRPNLTIGEDVRS